jgi:energy-coupling factor transport system ATP-binding protein
MVKGASILVFDEPTCGLDAENMRRVAEMIRKMAAEGRTVFVITHDYEFILQTCTRIVRMENGMILDDFPADARTLGRLRGMFFGS